MPLDVLRSFSTNPEIHAESQDQILPLQKLFPVVVIREPIFRVHTFRRIHRNKG